MVCLLAVVGKMGGQSFADQNESSELSPVEKAELRGMLDSDLPDLSRPRIRGALGHEQEHWRNPASVQVIRSDDLRLNGHLLSVDAFLIHLVNFTRWEGRHLPEKGKAPKIILAGNESRSFVDSLQLLIRENALKIEGQLVELRHFDNSKKAEAREIIKQGCQLVYVLPNASFTPKEINELSESAVVFGEGRAFVTEKGGDVSFLSVRNRVKLVVSEKYFRRNSPKLSSKLVSLKSVVEIIPSVGPQGPIGRKGPDNDPRPPPSK